MKNSHIHMERRNPMETGRKQKQWNPMEAEKNRNRGKKTDLDKDMESFYNNFMFDF